MTRYALDSNIVSYYLKGDTKLIERINTEARNSVIVILPLVYFEVKKWLLKNNSQSKLAAFESLLAKYGVDIISREIFDKALSVYLDLRSRGIIIEDADILIAAHCIQNDYILVTNNTKHFRHIPQLVIQNWV